MRRVSRGIPFSPKSPHRLLHTSSPNTGRVSYAFGEYLQRLPRGLRDVLLWSPVIAAIFFVWRQQPTYFMAHARQQLLRRPTSEGHTKGEPNNEREREGKEVCIRLDDAAGSRVHGVAFPVVQKDNSTKGDAVVPRDFTPPFSLGEDLQKGAAANVWGVPLRVVFDGDKVVGYAPVR